MRKYVTKSYIPYDVIFIKKKYIEYRHKKTEGYKPKINNCYICISGIRTNYAAVTNNPQISGVLNNKCHFSLTLHVIHRAIHSETQDNGRALKFYVPVL